jgi:hypothetical protein
MDTRRYILVGGLVCKYFPDLMKHLPQRSEADEVAEFTILGKILSLLSDNTELLAKLKEDAIKMTQTD